jgi:hypothetical protein
VCLPYQVGDLHPGRPPLRSSTDLSRRTGWLNDAKKNGYIGDTHAPTSYGKHSLSGQVNRCAILFGQKPINASKGLKENHTTPSSERWLLSGSGYCFGVGKKTQRMMNQGI